MRDLESEQDVPGAPDGVTPDDKLLQSAADVLEEPSPIVSKPIF